MLRRLSNKDIKELKNYIDVSKKDIVEICEIDGMELIRINGSYEFFKYNGKFVPTLRRLYAGKHKEQIKSITVDTGAIKFITNGADVMRPGVKEVEDGILKGEVVAVKEIGHGKIIALGEALFDSSQMRSIQNGKIVKNIHYIGDKIWNLE